MHVSLLFHLQRTLLPRTTGDTPQHVCSFSILSNSSATGEHQVGLLQILRSCYFSKPYISFFFFFKLQHCSHTWLRSLVFLLIIRLNAVSNFSSVIFPPHRNWILPANTNSPGSFVSPSSVQSFLCSIQQLCSSYSALQ